MKITHTSKNFIERISMQKTQESTSAKTDDEIRWFLVRTTVLFMPIPFIVFIFRPDAGVLVITTFLGTAVTLLYRYYFKSKK